MVLHRQVTERHPSGEEYDQVARVLTDLCFGFIAAPGLPSVRGTINSC